MKSYFILKNNKIAWQFLNIVRMSCWVIGCLVVLPCSAAVTEEEVRDCYQKSYRFESSKDYEEAIKVIMPVHSAHPQAYTVNLRLGWLNYLNGNYGSSKSYYLAAMKVAPSSIEAKLGYTLPLLALERYEETEIITKQIMRIDASNYYANLRFAFALRMQKKYEPAEEVLNRMLLLYPTDIKFLLESGLVKVAQNQMDSARKIFNEVLILDPENATAKAYANGSVKNSETKSKP